MELLSPPHAYQWEKQGLGSLVDSLSRCLVQGALEFTVMHLTLTDCTFLFSSPGGTRGQGAQDSVLDPRGLTYGCRRPGIFSELA